MNPLSNIWLHPKTSAAGLLIAIVTITSVLSTQGITLGSVGSGSIVTLISGLAAALLGLLARDPQSAASEAGSTNKLGAWALIALVLSSSMAMTGCTQQQRVSVAQEIVNWTPALVSSVDTLGGVVEMLDPASAIIVAPVTAGINAFAPQFELAAKNYLANPNQTTLALLQSLVVQLQQNTNASLLAAGRIVNPKSQKTALTNINLVATIVNTLLGLVQSISNRAQIAQMALGVHVTLAQVQPYMDSDAMQAASLRVSRDLALNTIPTPKQFFAAEASVGF